LKSAPSAASRSRFGVFTCPLPAQPIAMWRIWSTSTKRRLGWLHFFRGVSLTALVPVFRGPPIVDSHEPFRFARSDYASQVLRSGEGGTTGTRQQHGLIALDFHSFALIRSARLFPS
jgi:hypothetical protein